MAEASSPIDAACGGDTGTLLEEWRWVWRGSGLSNPEGPHLYRRGTCLGVRKRGGTPQFHTNGRETFLARIEWVDDWPVFAPADASIPSHIPVVDDDFPIISATEVAPERVCLVVEASADTSANAKTRAPDRIRLGVRVDDKHLTLANLDGRYLSTEVAGGFTGRVLGLVVDQGEAQVHRFRMRDTSIT